jgi:hypothetical protein
MTEATAGPELVIETDALTKRYGEVVAVDQLSRPLLEAVRPFYDTPETLFERGRTDALLERCAAAP